MSKPIPVSLLRNTGTLETYIKTVNGLAQYAPVATTLTRVRFQPVKQNAMTALGDMKNDRFTLFIDCVNSLPKGTVPAKKDRITFGNMALIVRDVIPQYGDDAGVHHYEVACV
jgi:hypothetical protein